MNRRWDKRSHQQGAAFMYSGGIFGVRCRLYPWRALHMRRVFSTCIHVRFDRGDFNRASQNVQAMNNHDMVPMFAYQWRPIRRPPPPGTPKRVVEAPIAPQIEWRRAA